jgi:tetratricopeptide (TPR) repeat protein
MLRERWQTESTSDDTDTITLPTRSALRWPFLLAAFFAWLASWVRLPFAWPRRVERVAAALVFVSLVGAEPIAENWLRRGNDAFARQEFDEAIRCWRQALPEADDPGRVAFDLAAAYFRKQDYVAAATAYRQALDDGELPAERGSRAWFDLGNALLEQAGTTDRRLLEQAMTAYRHCLAGASADLRGDAEHNLEIAGRRWLKTLPPPKDDDQGNEPTGPEKTKPEKSGNSNDPNNEQKGDPTADPNPSKGGDSKKGDPTNKASKGAITVLPDSPERAPLTADDAIAHLERAIGRIDRDRPPARPHDVPLRGKDW